MLRRLKLPVIGLIGGLVAAFNHLSECNKKKCLPWVCSLSEKRDFMSETIRYTTEGRAFLSGPCSPGLMDRCVGVATAKVLEERSLGSCTRTVQED